MEALPDPLLGKIFAVAGRQTGAAVTLVSRRWHRVFYAEPALWRSLELTAESFRSGSLEGHADAWFSAKALLLLRVGRFVQRIFYSQMHLFHGMFQMFSNGQQLAADIGSEWQLGSNVLAHLCPATLQSLRLYWVAVDAAAAAEMERLTSLTQLQINYRDDLPSCVLAVLPSLQQLLSLELRCGSIPDGLPAALQRLTRLTSLTCEGKSPLPELSAVMPLSRLRRLEWKHEVRGAPLQVDVQQLLARLPQLESWHLWMKMKMLQVGSSTLTGCDVAGCDREDGTVQALTVLGLRSTPSLHQLLAAALPDGTQPNQLRSLTVIFSVVPLQAVLSCPFLGHLTSLTLNVCKFSDEEYLAGLEALLQQAPRLLSLSLQGYFGEPPLPPVLVNRTGLRKLCLAVNGLSTLSPGPYLHSLESLNLDNNHYYKLPPALAAATNLTELSLTNNTRLVLSNDDVDDILARLPCLRLLYFDWPTAPSLVVRRLLESAPQLQIFDKPPRFGSRLL